MHANMSMFDANTSVSHTSFSFLTVSAHWAIVIVLLTPPKALMAVQRALGKEIQILTYRPAPQNIQTM